MGLLAVVELFCVCLSAIAGIVVISATFASKNAFDDRLDTHCPLFAKSKDNKVFEGGSKGICDSTIFAGFASIGVGLVFILQMIVVMVHERGAANGRQSRLRCLSFPMMLVAVVCVIGLLGFAIMVSAGVAVYCDQLESEFKKLFTGWSYPGCRSFDNWYHKHYPQYSQNWPSNGYLTMEVMLAGVWIALSSWIAVLVVGIIEYRRRSREGSFGFKEMNDSAATS